MPRTTRHGSVHSQWTDPLSLWAHYRPGRSLPAVIALVTATSAAHLDTDLAYLTAALADSGIEHRVEPWDDPSVDWSVFDMVIVRSTWDYHRRLTEFLTWVDAVDTVTTLANPAAMMRANVDKRYLTDLANDGVSVVPTLVITSVDEIHDVDFGGDIVVKPAVGAGANGARRIIDDPATARAHALELLGGSAVVVQPYLTDVDTSGEVGIVFIDGALSHAFNKAALLRGDVSWADGLYAEEEITPRVPTRDEVALATDVAGRFDGALYLRVDMLPSATGPVISEVEAVEPSLFCHIDPVSANRFAAAVRRRVG